MPLSLHTLPHRGSETDGHGQAKQSCTSEPKADRMHPSTTLIPRLVSVVEIIKREYAKKLNPELAENGCLSGLYQYNELGTLEEREDMQEKEPTEEDRLKSIGHALQGGNQCVYDAFLMSRSPEGFSI